jgi:hypothetical protein
MTIVFKQCESNEQMTGAFRQPVALAGPSPEGH